MAVVNYPSVAEKMYPRHEEPKGKGIRVVSCDVAYDGGKNERLDSAKIPEMYDDQEVSKKRRRNSETRNERNLTVYSHRLYTP